MNALKKICRFGLLGCLLILSFVLVQSCKEDDQLPIPEITEAIPSIARQGAAVEIHGRYFNLDPDGNEVRFKGVFAEVSSASSNTLTVLVPTNAKTGLFTVRVGTGVGVSPNIFEVIPQPNITTFFPLEGHIGEELTVVAEGIALKNDVEIRFTGTQEPGAMATIDHITQGLDTIRLTVPPGAVSGPLTLATEGLEGVSILNFILEDAPLIQDFAPKVAVPGKDAITIAGQQFGPDKDSNLVTFTGADPETPVVAEIQSANETEITVLVPEGAVQGPIVVTNLEAEKMAVSTEEFVPFAITAFEPQIQVEGQNITLTGSGFSENIAENEVGFFGDVMGTVVSATPTELVVTVPEGAMTGPIGITVGEVATSTEDDFNPVEGITITGFETDHGAIGEKVTVNGKGFTDNPDNILVTFGADLEAEVTSASNEQLEFSIPEGALSGSITIKVSKVIDVVTQSDVFTVHPTLTGISQDFGAEGQTIVLKGSNFLPDPVDNVVEFNGTPATVNAVSENLDELTVMVPMGAESGGISVTSGGHMAIENIYFYIVPKGKLLGSDSVAGDDFGYSLDINGEYAVVGAHMDEQDGNGAAYVYKKHPDGHWYFQQKLEANDGQDNDQFGFSVAISGNHIIIGAKQDNDQGIDSGSAYIFERIGEEWFQTAKLLAADGAAGFRFGNSVDVFGDYTIVGAWGANDNGTFSGAAYIFEKKNGNWTEVYKILPDDGAEFDRFGYSVAMDGERVLIGAWLDDDNGNDSGSAYVFKRTGEDWLQEAKLVAEDGSDDDEFGVSVALSGNNALIGAWRDDDNGSNSGSAYIFELQNDVWAQTSKLLADDGAINNSFGRAVAINGDRAVVGAHRNESKGAAYSFLKNGMQWQQLLKFADNVGGNFDQFGRSVAITSGNVIIIGAQGHGQKGNESGAAYIFED